MKLKLNIEYTEYNMSSLGNLNFLQQSRSPKAYKKGYFHNFHFAFVEVTSFLCLAGEELRPDSTINTRVSIGKKAVHSLQFGREGFSTVNLTGWITVFSITLSVLDFRAAFLLRHTFY